MLADAVDHIVGIDTHRDHHTAAVCDPTGAARAHTQIATDAFGFRRLLAFVDEHAPGRRVWAIEGTGSFGAGLTTYLLEHGEWVIEIDRPKRPARRNGAKSDELDAVRAAREALSREHHAQPRQRGWREALRVLVATREGAVTSRTKAIGLLKGLIVSAPAPIRDQLRRHTTDEQLARCARLRTSARQSIEHRATIVAIRSAARRALALEAEASDLETQIELIINDTCPWLLKERGIGPITAAQILIAYSHQGRFRSDAAFAALGGAAPIPASSGQTIRHRLNRGGDRQLNRALHTIVLSRMTHDPDTRAYAARRAEQGKSPRDIRRCLKRYLARQLYRRLQTDPALSPIPALCGT